MPEKISDGDRLRRLAKLLQAASEFHPNDARSLEVGFLDDVVAIRDGCTLWQGKTLAAAMEKAEASIVTDVRVRVGQARSHLAAQEAMMRMVEEALAP